MRRMRRRSANSLWADYLRQHVTLDQIRKNFSKALDVSLRRAHDQDARYLPGWSGVIAAKP